MKERNDAKALSRRQLLKSALWGGVGGALALDSLGGLQMLGALNPGRILDPRRVTLDSFHLMADAFRGGPSLFRWNEALADGPDDSWGIITIKLFDHTHVPLMFAMGALTEGGTKVATESMANANHPATRKAGGAANFLAQKGVKSLCTVPRMKALRFNEWFGKMLQHGTYDGLPKAADGANALGCASRVADFPDNVAIQCALGMQRDSSIPVHQLITGKVRREKGDLSAIVETSGLIKSPLGITCFMMGTKYDNNAGDTAANCVYENGTNKRIVEGRSVKSYVDNIKQSLSSGYFDSAPLDKNLTLMFDKLMTRNPERRIGLFENRQKLVQRLADFEAIKAMEEKRHSAKVAAEGNVQGVFTETLNAKSEAPASFEFLSQCMYVANALDMDGTPVRNFSLFMNIADLDGADMDVAQSITDATSYGGLCYIESMRQFAMGLNVLANAIKGKKFLILVVADGTRTGDMTDGTTTMAMVLGPKGAGGLDDMLYAPMDKLNSSSTTEAFIASHGSAANLPWEASDTAYGLREADGTVKPNTAVVLGDFQVGVLDFLEEKTGKKVRDASFGRFVKLKRG